MSEEKKNPCLFNNDIQCPAQKASAIEIKDRVLRNEILEKACPICPKRLTMIPARKIK